MGSDEQMLRIVEKNSHGVKRPLHPQLDTFIVDCACDVIRECQPDIVFLHRRRGLGETSVRCF